MTNLGLSQPFLKNLDSRLKFQTTLFSYAEYCTLQSCLAAAIFMPYGLEKRKSWSAIKDEAVTQRDAEMRKGNTRYQLSP